MRRDKKKRLARVFAVITAVSLLSLFIVRDVVRENLKDVHDSLAQAEALYRIYYGQKQSAERSQAQAFENLHKKFMALKPPDPLPNPNPSNPTGPWKPALASDIADLSNQADMTLVATTYNLYLVSELIDA